MPASKGRVLSLTRAMTLELTPYRIKVTAIAPGLADTAQPRYGSSEAEIVEMARAVPLGRMAQPDEIAQAAVFLASGHRSDPACKRRFLSGMRPRYRKCEYPSGIKPAKRNKIDPEAVARRMGNRKCDSYFRFSQPIKKR